MMKPRRPLLDAILALQMVAYLVLVSSLWGGFVVWRFLYQRAPRLRSLNIVCFIILVVGLFGGIGSGCLLSLSGLCRFDDDFFYPKDPRLPPSLAAYE